MVLHDLRQIVNVDFVGDAYQQTRFLHVIDKLGHALLWHGVDLQEQVDSNKTQTHSVKPPGSRCTARMVLRPSSNLGKDGSRTLGLDVLAELMEQYTPQGVALTEIPTGARPPGMALLDECPPVVERRQQIFDIRAHRIARSLDALPSHPAIRIGGRHQPPEVGLARELQMPDRAHRTRALDESGVPALHPCSRRQSSEDAAG